MVPQQIFFFRRWQRLLCIKQTGRLAIQMPTLTGVMSDLSLLDPLPASDWSSGSSSNRQCHSYGSQQSSEKHQECSNSNGGINSLVVNRFSYSCNFSSTHSLGEKLADRFPQQINSRPGEWSFHLEVFSTYVCVGEHLEVELLAFQFKNQLGRFAPKTYSRTWLQIQQMHFLCWSIYLVCFRLKVRAFHSFS